MNRLPKRFCELEVDAIERRIGENDAADGILSLEPDGGHGSLPW
jgi:hypothetical protein